MSAFFLKHPSETDLALFAGGELGVLARWRIERHLEGCERCGNEVADFFHLQEDVAELAELPPLDWNALAESIERRVAAEAPRVEQAEPSWFGRPLIWQAGLASACLAAGMFVVRDSALFAPAAEELAMATKLESAAQEAPRSRMLFGDSEADQLADAVQERGAPAAQLNEAEPQTGVQAGAETSEPETMRAALRVQTKKDFDLAKAKRSLGASLEAVEPAVAVEKAATLVAAGQTEGAGRRARAIGGAAPAAAYRDEARQAAPPPAAPVSPTPVPAAPVEAAAAFQEGEITVDGWILTRSFDDETGLVTLTHVY